MRIPRYQAENKAVVSLCAVLLVQFILTFTPISIVFAQKSEKAVSIIYTGLSFGALGAHRFQQEHELVTEQANQKKLPFKLVSHACWRAPGLAVFLPSDEPVGDELAGILAARHEAERIERLPALRSKNVLLVQDPKRPEPDMLAMLQANPRSNSDFPDIRPALVTMYKLYTAEDKEAVIVEEPGAIWPARPDQWTIGEMNRIDIRKTGRLFELPLNLGGMASRSTVLDSVKAAALERSAQVIVADLGQREGDFGVSRTARSQIDYTALSQLGYSVAVPYDFELSLGAPSLSRLAMQFPEICFLATNLEARRFKLFRKHLLVEIDDLRIGIIGLVDPSLKINLPKAVLEDFSFQPLLKAANQEIDLLKKKGVDAIIAFSNLNSVDNAQLAAEAPGIDVLLADLDLQWSTEKLTTRIDLPGQQRARPGAPLLISRNYANGMGVGRLELNFQGSPQDSRPVLTCIEHTLTPVTDWVPPDTTLQHQIRSMTRPNEKPRGDLMFPAFIDLIEQQSSLKDFDNTTRQGRMSKQLWEEFVARLLRYGSPVEVAIIRKFPHFPPLIGKLHEKEVRNWLWAEDEIILADLTGSALRKLLQNDVSNDLVLSGIDRQKWQVMGRRIDNDAFYRIATTDVIFEGARSEYFAGAKRIRRNFTIDTSGHLATHPTAPPLALRDFVLSELKRLRSYGKGKVHHKRIAELVQPDPAFEKLFSFNFDRPTFWFSFNQKYNSEGYGEVPESRVIAPDSWVLGVNGRFQATYDGLYSALDMGFTLAYARHSITFGNDIKRVIEPIDDIKIDLTVRKKGAEGHRYQSFLRGQFDTEITATVNPWTDAANPHQRALRGVLGISRRPTEHWQLLELGGAIEKHFGVGSLQYGLHARAYGRWSLGRHAGAPSYVFRNDANYFIPTKRDTPSDLAIRYNMVHELLFPLVGELSLSLAADLFLYKGKVDLTREPGMSLFLRAGLTYDRLWKPRYQPLF